MTIIAIDGPAASGKSSVSRGVAEQLGFYYINTGSMYRAVTWHVLHSGTDPQLAGNVESAMRDVKIHTGFEEHRSFIEIDGIRLHEQLHDESVSRSVSAVSCVPAVRERLVAEFHHLAKTGDCVVEGRDIGSVVFPSTRYKFYLDASPEVRQSRRDKQGRRDEVAARDRVDSSRHTAPLTIANDATVIDTSHLDLDDVIGAILHALAAKGLPACQRA